MPSPSFYRIAALLFLVSPNVWPANTITLNRTCPANPQPNSAVSYVYSIKNNTGSSIRYMTITVTLGTGLTFQSKSGSVWSCGNSGNTVTCTSSTRVRNSRTSGTLTINATTPATTGNISTAATAFAKKYSYSSSGYSHTPSACANTVTNPTPGYFNVFDSAGSCAGSAINTKIAGATFPLKITALNSARTAIDTTVNNTVEVYLVDMSNINLTPVNTSTNCPNALNLNGSNRPNSYLSTASVTLSGGTGTVTMPAVNAAYRKVGVFAVNTSNINNYGCATDLFAIRPNDFVVSVSDSNWKSAGTGRTLNNTGSGGNVHAAGRPFTITATARDASGNALASYNALQDNYFFYNDGTDDVAIAPTASAFSVAQPSGGNAGNVSGAFKRLSGAGQIQSTNATYDEAGSFYMLVEDDQFAIEDAKNVCSSEADRNITNDPASTPVGRFVPELLTITDTSTPKFRTFDATDAACPSRKFTYVGQPFGYSTLPGFTVRAWAFDDTDYSPTTNYRATGRLGTLSVAGGKVAYSNSNGQTIDTSLTGTASINDVGDGSSQLALGADDKIFFSRGSTAVAPFNATIGATVTVADCTDQAGTGSNACIPVCLDPGNTTDSNGTPPCSSPGSSATVSFANIGFDAPSANTSTPNAFRYGMLTFPSSGSAPNTNTAITLNMNAMYWTSGSAWSVNTLDNCTSVPATTIALSGYTQNLSQCETAVTVAGSLSSGATTVTLSAPGGNNKGSVNVIPNLGSTPSTDYNAAAPCNAASPSVAGAAALPWLQCTSSLLTGCTSNNPKTTATFNGTIQSPNRTRHLYLRELF